MSNTEQCSNCRFWDQADGSGGECRRYAPKPTMGDEPAFTFAAMWPMTGVDDWCGEHEPVERDEPEADETLDERVAGSLGFDPHAGDGDAL